MWLSQSDKLIVPVGSVILASLTTLVKCSVFTGSPSHLMQAEAVKFTELWCLRVVSADVGVISGSGLNGN